jgi:hypothetical protein
MAPTIPWLNEALIIEPLNVPMRINDAEYRRIFDTIDQLTAIDELAVYRAELRLRFAEDPKLERLEKVSICARTISHRSSVTSDRRRPCRGLGIVRPSQMGHVGVSPDTEMVRHPPVT